MTFVLCQFLLANTEGGTKIVEVIELVHIMYVLILSFNFKKKGKMTINNLKIFMLIFICLGTLVLSAQTNNKRRVLLFSENENNATLIQQKKILQSDEAGRVDRDIVIETFVLNQTDKSFLKKYNVKSVPFTYLLIGKDGHIALRSYKTIENTQLFGLIDAMPMRRDEMRRRGH